MQQDEPPGRGGEPEPEHERRRGERRRRLRRRRDESEDTAETVCETCDLVDSVRSCAAPGCGRLFRGRGGDGSGGCDCDGPCDLFLLRLSTLLAVAAVLVPARGAGGLVRALLRSYRRWLTRYTPACPSTPSCSAYALAAVETRGARAGLRAAAARVAACGQPF